MEHKNRWFDYLVYNNSKKNSKPFFQIEFFFTNTYFKSQRHNSDIENLKIEFKENIYVIWILSWNLNALKK